MLLERCVTRWPSPGYTIESPMRRPHLIARLLGVAALLTGCGEVTAPGVTGRWAATGIELVAQPQTAELSLPCIAPARVSHGLLPDSAGFIRFSTAVQPVWGAAYRVDFLGQLAGRWLFATVTRTVGEGPPVSESYALVRDGDSGLDKIFCAQ